MAGRVAGKIVVVTWGARGQGAAEAAALAAEGATVIATDVIEPTAELPAGVTFERLDVTDPGSWSRLGDLLRDRHGRLDGLINNAGIPIRARLGEVDVRGRRAGAAREPDRAAARHPGDGAADARRELDRQHRLDRRAQRPFPPGLHDLQMGRAGAHADG